MNTIRPEITGRGADATTARPLDLDDLTTWPSEWLSFIPMPEIEEITSLSHDTIVRRYRHLLAQLSPRRIAMRRGHAIMIGMKREAVSAVGNER